MCAQRCAERSSKNPEWPCRWRACDKEIIKLEKFVITGGKLLHGEVTISGAKNAAVLAVQMLALSDEELSAKLEKSKKDMIDGVIAKNEKLQKMVDEL